MPLLACLERERESSFNVAHGRRRVVQGAWGIGYLLPLTLACSLAPRVHLSKCNPLGGLAAGSRFPHFGSSYPGLGNQVLAWYCFNPRPAPPLRASLGPSSQDCASLAWGSLLAPGLAAPALLAFARGLLGCQGTGAGVTRYRGDSTPGGCHPSRGITHFAIRVSYRAITVAYRQLRGEGFIILRGI